MIEQQKVIDLANKSLTRGKSKRVEWLIRLLLSKELDDHEVGQGIVQGNIGSGFYANIYLTSVDRLFGAGNEWSVKFYRFVDDMILIIPEPEDGTPIEQVVSEAKQALEGALGELGLELNEDKTEIWFDTPEFIRSVAPDALLDQLDEEFRQIENRLWILDPDCRETFASSANNHDMWWYRVGLYCQCLRSIGIHRNEPVVSRRIHKYLFNPYVRQQDLKGRSELAMGSLPTNETIGAFQDWSANFRRQNPDWLHEKQASYTRLQDTLIESWNTLGSDATLPSSEQRKLETRIRFAVNRLSVVGFAEASDVVIEIMMRCPWVTREPSRVLESLAFQGYSDALLRVFSCYANDSDEANVYLRSATLRAFRFLPKVDQGHWELITKFALQGDIVERLMATETWLLLSDRPDFRRQSRYIPAIESVRGDPSLPERLWKNYLLLIGRYDSNRVSKVGLRGHPALQQAYQVSHSGEVSELLNYVEPNLIRQNYYSGRQTDDADYDYQS